MLLHQDMTELIPPPQTFVLFLPEIHCENSGTDGVHTSALIPYKICAENKNSMAVIEAESWLIVKSYV